MTIELKGARFFAYHGLYEEEKKLGAEFEINFLVSFQPASAVITDIGETINYVHLYEIVKREMLQPRELLETLAMEITEAVHARFPSIHKTDITITKRHPPVTAISGELGVRYHKEY